MRLRGALIVRAAAIAGDLVFRAAVRLALPALS